MTAGFTRRPRWRRGPHVWVCDTTWGRFRLALLCRANQRLLFLENRMRCFEILVVDSAVSKDGGSFVPDEHLTYGIPSDARQLLEPILGPYNQDPMRYFDKLDSG